MIQTHPDWNDLRPVRPHTPESRTRVLPPSGGAAARQRFVKCAALSWGMSGQPPAPDLFSEMQQMKRLSMLLFFGAGGVMALFSLFLPTRDPPSAELARVGMLIFGVIFLQALVWFGVIWRRPALIYGRKLDLAAMLFTNLCVVLAVVGETLLFRSQFSTMVILWPLVLVAGFMSRRLLPLQIVLAALSLFIIFWFKRNYINHSHSMTWLIEFAVTTVPLAVTALSVSYFRQATVREAQQLKRSVDTDFLTGLANRRALFERFPEVVRAVPSSQTLAVVLLDLDHFKTINDQYGHQVGDEVLQLFSRTLQGHTRSSDLAVRLGGEEFVWVIAEGSNTELMARIEAMRADFAGRSEARGVTVSAGVVPAPATARPSLTDLLNTADKLLYQAKESGRNQVRLPPPVQAKVRPAELLSG